MTNAVTFVVLVLGLILIVTASIMQRYIVDFKPPFFLGLLMVDIAFWMFSESSLRQIIFQRASLASYFTYISFEMFGILTCLFFDEVQYRRHHLRYMIMEAIVCLQLTVNIILHVTHVSEFHKTLVFAHIWLLVEFAIVVRNVISDIIARKLHHYASTGIGVIFFLALSVAELIEYYSAENPVFGKYVSIGLIVLTMATVIQVFVSQIRISKERVNERKNMLINVIETVAGTIDAKDEYTGGHSARVGKYSKILATAAADIYDLSEEDIERINYIGNMHDIGKIGVADTILNKPGRLTDDEFSLMKKHVDIGAELISEIGDNIEGLRDGILYHHERYDGKGYPEGLSALDIPLVARIICIADCYDAMTSDRVYRKRLSDEQVRNEFIKCSGVQFDPTLTEIFVKLMDSGELVDDSN